MEGRNEKEEEKERVRHERWCSRIFTNPPSSPPPSFSLEPAKCVTAGADVDKAADDGRTPAFVASQEGHLNVLRALIAAQADVNKSDMIGLTPLYIAAEKEHLEVARALLMAGASQAVEALGGTSLEAFSVEEGRAAVAELLKSFQ
jgi:hypothetical protein